MNPLDSQNYESYVPVYDVVPKTWEEGRTFLVEQLKKLATAVNLREIGWFLDQEVLTGKAFIPGANNTASGGTSQQFRTILRKVIDFGPIGVGVNSRPHGITVDANFTLIQLWAAATNSGTLTARPIPSGLGDAINMDVANINIASVAAFNRCIAVVEYIQEL
jgi:hypothetical protein